MTTAIRLNWMPSVELRGSSWKPRASQWLLFRNAGRISANSKSERFWPNAFCGNFLKRGNRDKRDSFIQTRRLSVRVYHMYEEPDFALSCVAAGLEVKLEPRVTIRHHYTGAQRNELRIHQLHARNEIWSALMHCPFPELPGVLIFRVVRQLSYANSRGIRWLVSEPQWWLNCFRAVRPSHVKKRRPINWSTYKAWMNLVRKPIFSQTEWRASFGNPPNTCLTFSR